MTEQVIQLEKVNKWYDDFHVLKDIDLSVEKGQKIVICGPSGSGKSTMIRCINRLEAHQEGKIVVHGTELTNDLKNIDEDFYILYPSIGESLDFLIKLNLKNYKFLYRRLDSFAWQFCNKGFFNFKNYIPKIIQKFI